jgi:hypothetical protein
MALQWEHIEAVIVSYTRYLLLIIFGFSFGGLAFLIEFNMVRSQFCLFSVASALIFYSLNRFWATLRMFKSLWDNVNMAVGTLEPGGTAAETGVNSKLIHSSYLRHKLLERLRSNLLNRKSSPRPTFRRYRYSPPCRLGFPITHDQLSSSLQQIFK